MSILGFRFDGLFLIPPVFNDHIRMTTLLLAAITFLVVSWKRRDPTLGLLVTAAWITVFELAYSLTGFLLRHSLWTQIYPQLDPGFFWWVMVGLFGWAWLSHAKGARPEPSVLLASLAIFVVWNLVGHGGNMPDRPIDWSEEVLNVGSKGLLGVAYLVGSLGWRSPATRWLEGLITRTDPLPRLAGEA